MDEREPVLVEVALDPEVHARLAAEARRKRVDVPWVISRAATDAAERMPKPKRRAYVRMTPDRIEEARELRALHWSLRAIAKEIGVSEATIRNHTHQLRGDHR